MSIDVVDLRNFYTQRLGVVARRFIGRGIRARFNDTRGMSMLGVGYATPYLGLFREEAERCLAFMPAAQGVVKWPSQRPSLATLVDELDLPLQDSSIDRVLLVHALEMAHDPIALLREVWRVLAAGGRLLAVVPNRRGLWARMDTTPFGHGRPYSRSQITHLLRDTWFTPVGWSEALYVPPIGRGWFLRSAVAWERAGATISAPFAGVHIVEATKQVYRPIPARRERRRLVPALEPALAPFTARSLAVAELSPAARRRRADRPEGPDAGRDGGAGGDAAGNDPADRRGRSGSRCWSRPRPAAAPPVMNDGSRSTSPLSSAAGCCCRVARLLRRLRLIAGTAAPHAANRVAARACRRLGSPPPACTTCWLPGLAVSSSSPSSKELSRMSLRMSLSGRLLNCGFCWRNCSCAAAIRRL